ncbi:MAG: hypothetical protein GX633_00565 [Clostridiales bacterium]|nr:hypothetical protein [Clostridiales bacterium]
MSEVKLYNKLSELPLGKITARGWIKEQLERSRDGMGGHLDELEPNMIAHPYVTRQTDEKWGAVKAGWGAEISGNYWYGLINLAFTLNDPGLIAKAEKWVNGCLANAREDGYLGTYTENDNLLDDYNGWGTTCGMRALMHYYNATGRKDVIDAVYRCMLWFCDNWAGDRKTRYAGNALIDAMSLCYTYTGDKKLLKFVDEYLDYLNRNDLYLNSLNAMLDPKLTYNSNHAATYVWLPKYMASAYQASGNPVHLQAAENVVNKAMKVYLPNGGIASNTEYLSPTSSVTETEYCTYSFYNSALMQMSAVTGDPKYGDMVERICFNGAQGARKKDEKCIAYFTSMNQIFSTDQSDFVGGDNGVYAPCYPVSCCPVVSVWIMPEFVRSMALVDGDGNIYLNHYGPASMDFGDIRIEEETLYPFRNSIKLTVSGSAARKLFIRIPQWCSESCVKVNGSCAGEGEAGTYFEVCSALSDGDVIEICFKAEVRMSKLDDSDTYSHYPVYLEYGALLFALPIPEVWKEIPGNPRTPLPEGWHWYNVTPNLIWDDRGDIYEQQGLRKYNITWNVAINENLPLDKIEVIEEETEGYVWEDPKLKMKLPGYKAIFSYAPYIRKTHEVYQSPIDVQEELELELVPYGCVNLRITCFPRANI